MLKRPPTLRGARSMESGCGSSGRGRTGHRDKRSGARDATARSSPPAASRCEPRIRSAASQAARRLCRSYRVASAGQKLCTLKLWHRVIGVCRRLRRFQRGRPNVELQKSMKPRTLAGSSREVVTMFDRFVGWSVHPASPAQARRWRDRIGRCWGSRQTVSGRRARRCA